MNDMDMMFSKKKHGARRLPKEAAASSQQRSRGSRKGKTQEFFRLMSMGLSSPHTPVLRRHD
jgi:hypothetical protein